MTRDTSDLLGAALALPDDERAQLVRALIESLDGDEEDGASAAEIESAWRAEVERRERELEDDPATAVPAEQVFAEAERRLQEIRRAREQRRRPA